jgi:hypothetical protein
MKRILAVALVALAINCACATSAPAQSNKDILRISKLRKAVEKIGFDERVEVRLNDGTKLEGRITRSATTNFGTITDQKQRRPRFRIPMSNEW